MQELRTFFPQHWEGQQVIDAISEAYGNRVHVGGTEYEGCTAEGMHIIMVLDAEERIVTGYPRMAL